MTTDELRAILDPAGARPAPYWPQLPDPGPLPASAERLAIQRETGHVDPRWAAARAYQAEARRCWGRRMALVERAMRERAMRERAQP